MAEPSEPTESLSPGGPPSRQSSPGVHPRRKAAKDSVSLLHYPISPGRPRSNDGTTASSMQVDQTSNEASVDGSNVASNEVSNEPSNAPTRPSYQKGSSGESSNPEKWFEKSNNNPKTGQNFADDEPPFFLRNSSSETTPPDGMLRNPLKSQTDISRLRREQSDPQDTSASSSEDFRSVIDDLTIQNKKLKRKLRRYERLHNAHLHEDKLFEVRVHGLSAEKKRELEEMLKEFVTKIEGTPQSQSHVGSGVSYHPSSLQPGLTSSSNTSTRFGDSGYATMSGSGHHSSGQASSTQRVTRPSNMSYQQKEDIQSYLHDIPAGLLPNASGPLSDRTKRKTIVQRLEQIFAGKDPASGGHQQPIQQQKVAQSAARADRREMAAKGEEAGEEGSREARIMPKVYDGTHQDGLNQTPADRRDVEVNEMVATEKLPAEIAELALLEQRPTRPLDLDPYRAQVPAENIKYMRHLGFSPQDVEMESLQEDGHGWIYLNVLTNMAQLHTINVTPEFVRKAIAEYSHMLELSPDGRKVRWKGGNEVTLLSHNNSPEGVGGNADHAPRSKSGGDGSKSHLRSSEGGSSGSRFNGNSLDKRHKLAYSPLFIHKEESETGDTGFEEERTNWSSNAAGNSSGNPTSSGAQTRPSRPSRGDDGAIIFYNKVGFYTDLSGDVANPLAKDRSNYTRLEGDPLGSGTAVELQERYRRLHAEKGPFSFPMVSQTPSPDSTSSPMVSDGDLKVMGHSSHGKSQAGASSSSDSLAPIEFEASGLGGIFPADNFRINVRSRQNAQKHDTAMDIDGARTPQSTRRQKAYPLHIRSALERTNSRSRPSSSSSASRPRNRPVFQREIMSSRLHDLPASSLPEPSFYHFSSTDNEDDESQEDAAYDTDESENASSVAGQAGGDQVSSVRPSQGMDWAATGLWNELTHSVRARKDNGSVKDDDSDKADVGDDDNDEDDQSIDLLATARKLAPNAIRAREREFDSNIAERLAEEIPAGSSAATADGGSGFTSPVVKLDGRRESFGQINQIGLASSSQKRARGMSLKRARRSDDSMLVHEERATKSPRMETSE